MSTTTTTTHFINNYNITEYVGSNIYIFNNVFDKDFCDKMIKLMDNADCMKKSFTNYNNVECFNIDISSYCLVDTNVILDKRIHDIFDTMSILTKYVKIFGVSTFELRKVYGKTREHADGTCPDNVNHPYHKCKIRSVRSLTMVGVFNDDYEGGVYHFPIQNINVKLKAGSVILFPPYWTHPHEVSEIKKIETAREYRYTISCWGLDDFVPVETPEEMPHMNNILIL